MAIVIRPPPHPVVENVLHRVHAWGTPHTHSLHHESADPESAHARALELSAAHPLQRFEVRGVPASVPARDAQGAQTLTPNPGNKFERVIAVYQAGAEIPIT